MRIFQLNFFIIATGSNNTANGDGALRYNTTGGSNTANGFYALRYNITGNYNTALGYSAGLSNETGSGNVFIGYEAGYDETGSDRLYIANSQSDTLIFGEFDTGRVGIGTTSPATALDVAGTVTATSFSGDGSGLTGVSPPSIAWSNISGMPVGFADDIDDVGITAETDPIFIASAAQGISAGDVNNWNNAHYWGDHAAAGYDTTNDAWTGTGDIYTTSGNVGIGTMSPIGGIHLHNKNSVQITSSITGNETWLDGVSMRLIDNKHLSFYALETGGNIQLNSDAATYFYTSAVQRMTIDASGNIGIGTVSPQYKLDVNGSINVNGAIYQRGGELHADYVFEPEYTLESIEEHAEYMWENKHLKAVPKAKVDADGQEIVEVGAHRKGIVEELEKAHIYIAQLNKCVEKQSVLIADLLVRIETLERR